MKGKYKRLWFILLLFLLSIGGLILVLDFLKENIAFYYTPSESKNFPLGKKIRVGGKVVNGSVHKDSDGISFMLSDDTNVLKVYYKGSLPILFNEDVEIIVSGFLKPNNEFLANKIFTKHNEIYRRKSS